MNRVNPLNATHEIKDRIQKWKIQMNHQRNSVSDDDLQVTAQCSNLIMANYEHETEDEALVYHDDGDSHGSDPSDGEGTRTRLTSQASQSTKDMDVDHDDDYEQSPKEVNRDEASIPDEDELLRWISLPRHQAAGLIGSKGATASRVEE
ncbi:hypothetical protein HDE_00662 [Halotydeus destructor]|nr:hypothetical protein HDE_00662 [Halotydeus destructor]